MKPRPAISGPRLEILRFLEMRWDTAARTLQPFIVPFEEMVAQLGMPAQELHEHLTPLESEGYVKGVRLPQGLLSTRTQHRGPRRPLRDSRAMTEGYYITGLGHVIVALVSQWTVALKDAEAIQVLITPGYRRHSDAELLAIATEAVASGRDPRDVVAEVLGEKGAPNADL